MVIPNDEGRRCTKEVAEPRFCHHHRQVRAPDGSPIRPFVKFVFKALFKQMSLKRTILYWFVLWIGLSPLSFADEEGGVESIFHFGAGARAMGMGRAFVAISDDASSIYWNPAGLQNLGQQEVTALRCFLFAGTSYNFIGYAYPTLKWGNFGLGGLWISTGDIPHTTDSPQILDYWENVQAEYLLSWGTSLPLSFKGGLSFKFLTHRLGPYSASGFSFDLGFLRPLREGLNIGLNLQDIGGAALKLKESTDITPPNLKLGLSYALVKGARRWGTLAIDLDKLKGCSPKFHLGFQFEPRDGFCLRSGWDEGRIAFGGGMRYRRFQLDYALRSYQDLGLTHRLSLTTRFGSTLQQRRIAEEKKRQEEERRMAEARRRERMKFHSEKGGELYRKGDLSGALAEYQRVLAWDAQNSDAQAKIESITQEINKRLVANIAAEKSRTLIEAHIKSGLEYRKRSKYNLAIEEFERILKLDPQNEEAKRQLGSLRKLLQDEIGTIRRRAKEDMTLENFVGAIEEYNRLLDYLPGDPEAEKGLQLASQRVQVSEYTRKGVEKFEAGEYKGAILEFNSILKIDPGNQMAKDYLQKAISKSAKPTSLAELRKDPTIWNLYLDGLSQYQKGNYREAIKLWEKVLEYYPNNENTLRNIEEARVRLKGMEK